MVKIEAVYLLVLPLPTETRASIALVYAPQSPTAILSKMGTLASRHRARWAGAALQLSTAPLPEIKVHRIIDGDCNDTDIVDMGAYEFSFAAIGDFEDFAILGSAWLTEPGDDSWNLHCDISVPADSRIDWRDLSVLTDNWLAVK